MKADPFVQARLLDLQALDTRLTQLAHKKRTLPVLAEIEKASSRLGIESMTSTMRMMTASTTPPKAPARVPRTRPPDRPPRRRRPRARPP